MLLNRLVINLENTGLTENMFHVVFVQRKDSFRMSCDHVYIMIKDLHCGIINEIKYDSENISSGSMKQFYGR